MLLTDKHPTLASEKTIRTQVDKVSQYGMTITDKPGSFREIPKGELWIDDRYQRDLSPLRVKELGRHWSWIACGAIIVAARRSGGWYVIDGQHRVAAALRRSDITNLPCLVFDTVEIIEEAIGFLQANVMRKPPPMSQRFKALLITNDEVAREVQRFAEFCGREIGQTTGPTTLGCVQECQRAIRADRAAFRRVSAVIKEVTSGYAMTNAVVGGFCYLEAHLPDGETLSSKRWTSRIIDIGLESFLIGIQRACVYRGHGGPKIWAEGIANVINAGLRNRLPYGETK